MKDKLQNAFKDTPQRFTNAVHSAITTARQTDKTQRKMSKPMRMIVAFVLVFALLPSAVFGAVKLSGAIAQRVGFFGMSFNIEINKDAPKYVKMNVDVPKGFREQENTAGLKYERDSEEWEFGFTILPMRFYDSVDYTVLEKDVKEYNEVIIASRSAYEIIGTDSYQGLRRYYVWYEEANVLMLIYIGDTVTDKELREFVDCISFTQGTEYDHDSFFEPEKEADELSDDAVTYYDYERSFIETETDTKVTFAGFCEESEEGGLRVDSVITDIRVTDNINGLDADDIYSMYRTEDIADSNGKLLPKTVEIWREGDGVNTESKLLSAQSMDQKLVLIDIEYKNTTDKQVELYIPYRLETLTKDELHNYKLATDVDKAQNIVADQYCDGEIFYMSSHGESDKDFCIITLDPDEKRVVTLGFRCVQEQLENAYLVLNPQTDGVITPEYTQQANTYLIFKVQ